MRDAERLERLQRCLDELVEDNRTTTVLVEGPRDEQALRTLGLQGPIRILNTGQSVAALADDLARSHARIILLLDWDRTGGHLARKLSEQLEARVELDQSYRKELAQVSLVRSVEDLPAALREVQRRAEPSVRRRGDAAT